MVLSFTSFLFGSEPPELILNGFTEVLGDSLPADFPLITVDTINEPSPGYYFMTNRGPGYGAYLMILDNQGKPVKYKKMPIGGVDFKVTDNGYYSYGNALQAIGGKANVTNFILDSSLTPIDSFKCGNGFIADYHEFKLLPNGNAIMVTYETVNVDMSKITPGGNPNANVTGTVFQEVDANKKVVFQWRSLDHLPITDTDANPLTAAFDHVHGNAAFLDFDGNYLISLAVSNEIIKVNRATGYVIWRFSGRHNNFTITGEHEENKPFYFSKQHDIQRLPNGNLLFFDNGTMRTPNPYARAVEYKLDEVNMTATLVWEWKHTPDIFAFAEGSAQRLPNGNTLIGWGVVRNSLVRAITEVKPDGSIAFEMHFPTGITCYRAYKFDLPTCPEVAKVELSDISAGNSYDFNNTNNITSIKMNILKAEALTYNFLDVKRYDCPPKNCSFVGKTPFIYNHRFEFIPAGIDSIQADVRINSSQLPFLFTPEKAKVYFRETIGTGKFSEVPTTYNASKELVFTAYRFGEYILGMPLEEKQPEKPILVTPENNKRISFPESITMFWSLSGNAVESHLIYSTDSTFSRDTVNLMLSSTKKIYTSGSVFSKDSTYFWKVQSSNQNGLSPWSDTWNFTPVANYINVINPNGGETLLLDSSKYIIRWDKNSSNLVKIELFINGSFASLIKDSLKTQTNGFFWIAPLNTPEDSTYKIRITSIGANPVSAESASFFTIKNKPLGVEEDTQPDNISVNIYPNPANKMVNFEIIINSDGNANLSLFDVNGNKVSQIINDYLVSGKYHVTFPLGSLNSGTYFYQLRTGNQIIPGRIEIIK